MSIDNEKELMGVITEIPLFQGLSPNQAGLVLSQCIPRSYPAGERMGDSGSPADELYILISGEVSILAQEDRPVTTVGPGGAVGEIGVITGKQMTATVEATMPTRALVLPGTRLADLLGREPELRARVNENAVRILGDRLTKENIRLRDVRWNDDRHKDQVEDLKRRLEAAEDRAGADEAEVPRQILVVDDEPVICRVIAKTLASFSVVHAHNGRAALEIIEETPPDLVITDIRMPELDGVALLTNLRSRHPRIPVLAISGYLQAGELQGYKFDAFLEKPVNLEDLKVKVKELLATHGRSR